MTQKNNARTFYWDSCVFLSAIDSDPERAPTIVQLLEECDEGGCEIFTSQLSITEVCFIQTEKTQKSPNPDIESKIASLWNEESPVKMVEVHEVVAREALRLIRDALAKGFGLKPPDAIHLATAKLWNVSEFHTYDSKLFKYAEGLGFRIVEPHIDQLLFHPPDTSPIRTLRREQWHWREPRCPRPDKSGRYVSLATRRVMHRL